jgi:hypothetical protein
MSNEKADEFLSWRTALAQPDALPEQGLDDPEAAWQQLYARLEEKPRRHFFYWYGIAAACLLLLLIPAALLFRSRTAGPRPSFGKPSGVLQQASATRPAKPAKPLAAGSPMARTTPAISITSVTPPAGPLAPLSIGPVAPPDRYWKRPPRMAGASKISRVLTRLLPPVFGRPVRLPALPSINAAAPAITVPLPPLTTPSLPGARLAQQPATAKRSLRVISINEINNPGPAGPATALEQHNRIPFSIHFRPSGNPSGESVTALPEETDRLTIKIALQNP